MSILYNEGGKGELIRGIELGSEVTTSSSTSLSESRSSESRSIVYKERSTCLVYTRASITSYNIRTICIN